MIVFLRNSGVLVFCLLAGLLVASVPATNAKGDQEVPSRLFFLANMGDPSVPRFQAIPSETRLPPGEYSAKAHMVDKIAIESRIANSIDFQLKKGTTESSFGKSAGWSRLTDANWWSPGSDQSTLTVPLSLKEKEKSLFNKFDEFHFEFQALGEPGLFPFLVGLEMEAEPGNPEDKKVIFVAGEPSLKLEETLKPTSKNWYPKNYFYLLKREMNLEPDTDWRFINKGGFTVVQRRFQKNIKPLEAMDIVVPPNWPVITINLKVGFEGPYRPTEILALHDIFYHRSKAGFEETFRIYLGKLIRERYGKFEKVNLEEVVVFFEDPAQQVAQHKPLKRILFHKLDMSPADRDSSDIVQLPLEIRPLSATTYRASVRLNAVKGKELSLKSTRLKISPENPAVPGGLVFHQARLAQLESLTRPEIIRTSKKLGHRWGGPFLPQPESGKIETTHIDAYFPFHVLDRDQTYHSGLIEKKEVQVQTTHGSQARVHYEKQGLVCDFLFLDQKSRVNVELKGIGPFAEERDITLEFKQEGDLLLKLIEPDLGEITSNTLRFILPANSHPMIEVLPPELESPERTGRQRGRLLITGASVASVLEDEDDTVKSNLDTTEKSTVINGKDKNSSENVAPLLNPLLLSSTEKIDFTSPGIKSPRIKSIRVPGLRISARHPFDHWRPVQGGVLLKGRGRWVDLQWKHPAKLSSESRFFLSVLKGEQDIDHLEILPQKAGQTLPPLTAEPNEPVILNSSPREIDGLNVRIHLKSSSSFSLVLSEMTLFHSRSTPINETLDIDYLMWERTALNAKPITKPETLQWESSANRVLITGSFSEEHRVLEWSNPIHQPMDWVRGLRVKYQSAWEAGKGSACWLQLNWKTRNHQGQKRFCFNKPVDDVYIPASSLFEKMALKTGEPLESLVWKIEGPTTPRFKSMPLALDLEMELDALRLSPLRHELARHPVLQIEQHSISPTSLEKITTNELVKRDPWVELGNFTIPPTHFKTLNMEVLDSPYLRVEAVVIQSHFPLPEGFVVFKEEDSIIHEKRSVSPFFLVATLILMWGLFLMWKKVNSSPALMSKISNARIITNRWVLGPHVILNRLIGLLVLGPGLLLSGWMSQKPDTLSVLEPLLLLLAGVFWHETRWALQKYPRNLEWSNPFINGNTSSTPMVPHLVLAGVVGWSAWFFGSGVSETPTETAAALCLSSIYFYLPWVRRVSVRILLGLVFAGGCYLGSLSQAPTSMLPSLGGLALILTWLNILQWTRPAWEKRHLKSAQWIYQSISKQLFLGLLVLIPVMAFLIFLQLEVIAEPIAIIIYLLLAGGILAEIWTHLNPPKEPVPDTVSEANFDKVSSGG